MRNIHAMTAVAALTTLTLIGCGGGTDSTDSLAPAGSQALAPSLSAEKAVPDAPAANTSVDANTTSAATTALTVNDSGLAPRAVTATLSAAGDPGLLLLLLPDGQPLTDARVMAWQDAASEVGVRLAPITDSAFQQLGSGASAYAGLVLPDSLHTRASDELIAAITAYTEAGGHTLLTFDFGALLPNGFYATTGASRLSALAGVDYVMYDALRERTTGFGPVTALRSTLRALQVPPGKSLPYAASTGLVGASATAAANDSPLQKAAGSTRGTALYLPVSPADPGGARGFDPQQFLQLRHADAHLSSPGKAPPRRVVVNYGRAFKAAAVPGVTRSALARTLQARAVGDDPTDTYTGYLLGPLMYPSYVTQGPFSDGTVPGQSALVTSPQFGLVAGVNPVGQGQVLFVNLPLTYLKGRTDALPMHGFLHYFSHQLLRLAHLSAVPNGVAGITLDWHLDAKEAQAPTQRLIQKNVFGEAGMLFSIDMTAGPDLMTPGDALGWNLPGNKVAKNILRNFNSFGHAVGSHGGWIHNFYGPQATETNRLASTGGACFNPANGLDNFEQCLVRNHKSVDNVLGRVSRSYSAPEGNNPPWAMDWLERRGVVAAYFGGHTGLGVTRQYRDDVLRNPAIWVHPVTPQGLYATYEEFQAYQVPKAEVMAWNRDLMDFNIAQNTTRMAYAHPAGADAWFDVLNDMFGHARTQRQAGRLAWYTMPQLADFMTTRDRVVWSEHRDAATGTHRFTADHPLSLNTFTWRLPRSQYAAAPLLVSGNATVDGSDATYWLVHAGAGTHLEFSAQP
jgi:hypothetical protein